MTCSKITWLLLGVVAAAAAGCQGKAPKFIPVEGTVTQGGKPLAGVLVEFVPESGRMDLRSSSVEPTDAAGHYQLHGLRGENGAIAGPHRVCIYEARGMARNIFGRLPKEAAEAKEIQEKAAELKNKGLLEPAGSSRRIPKIYSNNSKTPLRVEVRPDQSVINLEVKVN
jgi:hypothetical protein